MFEPLLVFSYARLNFRLPIAKTAKHIKGIPQTSLKTSIFPLVVHQLHVFTTSNHILCSYLSQGSF
jgi:hypothetical protein